MVLEWVTDIFDKVLKEEKIPSAWKKGVVTALYKGGRKQELGNYRGITVNSSICINLSPESYGGGWKRR